jgi:hypothetical protein
MWEEFRPISKCSSQEAPRAAGEYVWSDKLQTVSGKAFLRALHTRTGAFVYCDSRRRELRLHGEPDAMQQATESVLSYLEALEAQLHEVPLHNHVLRILLRGSALEALRTASGAETASLRLSPPSLLLEGPPEVSTCLFVDYKRYIWGILFVGGHCLVFVKTRNGGTHFGTNDKT